jgi:hypothetical protein
MNAQSKHTPQEVVALGRSVYDASIRLRVETPENIGKLISIEVLTGDYEIGESSLETIPPLRGRHADPVVATLRIGYKAAFTRSGRLTRETPQP